MKATRNQDAKKGKGNVKAEKNKKAADIRAEEKKVKEEEEIKAKEKARVGRKNELDIIKNEEH